MTVCLCSCVCVFTCTHVCSRAPVCVSMRRCDSSVSDFVGKGFQTVGICCVHTQLRPNC